MRYIPTNIVTSEPAAEPVTASNVKDHLQLTNNTTWDTEFDSKIAAARQWVEAVAGRSLITQTRRQSYDYIPDGEIFLRYSPVSSVTTFAYTDTAGDSQTLASSRYSVDTDSMPGRITVAYNQTWPSVADVANAVQITYVAGYGSAGSDVPDIYKRAIIMLVGEWFEHRCGTFEQAYDKLIDFIGWEGISREYA